jgi:hypothetical protein
VQSPRVLQKWLLEWFGRCDPAELSVGMMVLYQLWYARNEARDLACIEDPEKTASRSLHLVEEWKSASAYHAVQVQTRVDRWSPPEPGWHKANVDGATPLGGAHGGGGVVLRDAHGGFVAGAGRFYPSVSDAERPELLACRTAVLLAKDLGIPRLVLETDCMGANAKITGRELDRSMHGPLVEEIKALLHGFDDYKVQHVSRKCNGVAHLLAKGSCENKSCNTWFDSPPGFIVDSVALDYANV